MFQICRNLYWPSGSVEENENVKTLQRRQQQWRRTMDKFNFNKFESPSPKDVFLLFLSNLPLERGVALHLYKLESPSPKNALCQVWWKLAQWYCRRRFLKILSMYFCYFLIISPWKRVGPSFEQTWILFTQGCFVPNLVEIGLVALEKKIFKNFVNVFSLFCNYPPLEKGRALQLNKLEFPSTKDALC